MKPGVEGPTDDRMAPEPEPRWALRDFEYDGDSGAKLREHAKWLRGLAEAKRNPAPPAKKLFRRQIPTDPAWAAWLTWEFGGCAFGAERMASELEAVGGNMLKLLKTRPLGGSGWDVPPPGPQPE